MDNIYRTVYMVEVFSEGELSDDMDIDAVYDAITEGDCIGSVEKTLVERVPSRKVRSELIRIGNDGTFFDPI